MKYAKFLLILPFMALLFDSCNFEEGNPDLSGQWTCTETSEIFLKSGKGTSVYPVYLSKDADSPNKYNIDNFYRLGSGKKVSILVNGSTVTIPKQSVNAFVFEGSGTVNVDNNLIELTYTADDFGGEIDHVHASYTR